MSKDYTEAFLKACSFTEHLGCVCPKINVVNEFFLDSEEKQFRVLNSLQKKFNEQYGVPSVADFFAQCISTSYLMQPVLSEIIGSPCALTFGYVTEGGEAFFRQEDIFFHNSLRNGVPDIVNIHAWLTLPSMEILDLTLCTTRLIALLRQRKLEVNAFHEALIGSPDFGGIIVGDGDNLKGTDVKFHPQVIGEDFMLKAGFLRFN